MARARANARLLQLVHFLLGVLDQGAVNVILLLDHAHEQGQISDPVENAGEPFTARGDLGHGLVVEEVIGSFGEGKTVLDVLLRLLGVEGQELIGHLEALHEAVAPFEASANARMTRENDGQQRLATLAGEVEQGPQLVEAAGVGEVIDVVDQQHGV